MGLTIHYSGRIRNFFTISSLVDEVEDVCKTLQWDYQLWANNIADTDINLVSAQFTPSHLNGISLNIKNCVPIFLTFLPDGRLCSPLDLMDQEIYPDESISYTISSKTQFAGFESHLTLMKIFYYLRTRYFVDLKIIDEGMYWETKDEKVLQRQFERYDLAMEIIEAALQDIKIFPGETAQSLSENWNNG
jgi:hypothetical protein